MRGVAEHGTADAVDAADVNDGVHHADVADADPLLDLTAGKRADHELRDAERKSAHGGGADGGASRAAEAEDALDLALRVQRGDELRGPMRRSCDCLAAIAGFA